MIKDQKGFSFIEAVAMLGIIAVLGALITPMVAKYVKAAKFRKAENDVKVIAASIAGFNGDTREWPIWHDGDKTTAEDNMYSVLYTEAGTEAESAHGWQIDEDSSSDSDSSSDEEYTIDGQLISNCVNYPKVGPTRWMGPYLEKIGSDPWGGKYYVNIKFLQPGFLSPGSERAVFVLSPGPNEEIDTNFDQEIDDFSADGDDITYRIK